MTYTCEKCGYTNREIYVDKTIYRNKEGIIITKEEYHKLKDMRDPPYKYVRKRQNEKLEVSTVWIGECDCHSGEPCNHLFETMVFKRGTGNDIDTERYKTLEEAIKGHEEFCLKYNLEGFKDYYP